MDGSFQSLEALPIKHLHIVFVASSSCSEDDMLTPSSVGTTSTPACQQRSSVKKNLNLANGNVNPAQPKVHDVKIKARKASGKVAMTKKVMVKTRERSKRVETEKKPGVEEEVLDAPPDGWPLRRVISIEEDHLPHLLHGGPQPLLHQLSEEEDEVDDEEKEAQSDAESSVVMPEDFSPPSRHTLASTEATSARKPRSARAKKTPLFPRGQPVGKETQQVSLHLQMCFNVSSTCGEISAEVVYKICFFPSLLLSYLLQKIKERVLFAPDRLFKVVLVGNSSVGKTSLLRSFCEGRFHPSTTATVGEKKDTALVFMHSNIQGLF